MLAAAMMVSLFACGDDGGAVNADAGPPTIEIGTGQRDFESLQEGDSIFIVQGPQDGYHFFGSLRATNVNAGDAKDLSAPENPTTTFEVFVGTDRFDAMASTYVQGLKVETTGAEMIGRNVILNIEDDSELDGATVRFVVSVMDVDGVLVTDERTLMATPHPNNQ
jgi:hypothetical protein